MYFNHMYLFELTVACILLILFYALFVYVMLVKYIGRC